MKKSKSNKATKPKSLNVGTKLILRTVPALIVILIAAFAYVIVSTSGTNENLSNNNLQSLVEKDAAIVKAHLEEPLNIAKTIAKSMQGFENISAQNRRSVYNGILKSVLADNPKILGVWCIWEPNALDGLDAKYTDKDGADTSGRFVPYWQRADGTIVLTPCVDYEKPGLGDYYLKAKNSGAESILDPYQYQIDGKNILLTTVSVPIKDGTGKVVGVAGVDLSLDSLQGIAFDKGGFASAYSYLISNSGIYVIHNDAAAIGQNIQDQETTNTVELAAAVSQGKAYTYNSMSATTKSEVKRVLVPVTIGNTATPWSFAVAVDYNEIRATTMRMVFVLNGILVAVIVACSAILLVVVRGTVTRPLLCVASLAKSLASGDLGASVRIESQDEIGQLAGTLDNEVRHAFLDVEKARLISEKQEKYQTAEVNKLLINLQRLSKGDLNCDIKVDDADSDTQALHALFRDIAQNLQESVSSIRRYIAEISQVLGGIADNNLNVEITSDFLGEFSELKRSINTIIEAFNKTISGIGDTAVQVAAGTRQVSEGSQTISQGATEQASAIEQLSATITEIAGQTKKNALNAGTANELSNSAKRDAQEGNDQMMQLLRAMVDINDSSESISKIIKVIDDIAFQTNILALNAAVEAAHAGAHGKGFAVVAEEVRNLAQKSANAAKDTTAMIESSMKKVEVGAMIADQTALALGNIVSGVEQVTNLVGDIAVSSRNQALGISQVNNGIDQLSQVVQTNSATAQQAAAASEELSSQADLLSDLVSQFELRS